MWWILSGAIASYLPVSQNIRQRISADSSKLGNVAESLLGVQNDINRVEKEVMGKVFDLQTVRQFFSTHQALQVERDDLAQETEHLQGSIKHLSEQVEHEKSTAVEQQTRSSHELAMKASEISSLQVHVQTLHTELNKRKTLEVDKFTLQRLNQVLRDQLTLTTTNAEQLQREVVAVQQIVQVAKSDIEKLSAELIKQHTYGEQCHSQITQLQQRLTVEMQEEKTHDKASQTAAGYAKAAAYAAEQRLLVDNKLLEQHVAKQERMVKNQAAQIENLNQRLTITTKTFSSAQDQAKKEVQRLKIQEGVLRSELKTCDSSLMENVEARNGAENQLHECKQKLLGTGRQMLEMKLAQCMDFQKQVSKSLNTAQINLATCTAAKDQAINSREAAEKQLTIMKGSMRKMMEETQAQIVAKTQEAAKAQEDAQKAIMQAEAELSGKCSVVWRKRNKKVQKQLKQCKVLKEDLRMSKAQTLTLEQSLKACMQTQ